jgi:hypothetical protein
VWWILITLNLLLAYDQAIVLLGIDSNKLKTNVHTKPHTRVFLAALLVIAPAGCR